MPQGDDAVARWRAVRAAITRAAGDCDRDPASVTLLAISKTFPAEAIAPVLAAGERVFGENYVQEAAAKWPALRERFSGVELHLVGPLQSNKAREAVEIARATESSISTYLLTTAVVNVTEGIAVAGAMYLLGMPNPALWGALVAVFEFIPYLGATAMVVILTIASLTTFDNTGQALLVPAAFLGINLIQGNLVSPTLLGHRLALNPVAIFVGLAFWYWVWGIPGAFLAVPLMATLKIVCDHVEALASFGEFLGGRDEGERRALLR